MTPNTTQSRIIHTLAIAQVASTAFLIFVGGTVTSNDAGLAVPDWPTTFGQNMFLYPPSQWVGGVFYEHTHRLLGAAVGLLAIVLVLAAHLREPRLWVKAFAWIMLLAVILQGLLGGFRVTEVSITLAVIHGCLGQLFLCMTVCMALFTTRTWNETGQVIQGSAAGRWLCVFTSGLVFLQLIVGALYRHMNIGLAYHVAGAIVVTLAIGTVMMWITGGEYRKHALLMRLTLLMSTLLIIQLVLGLIAYLMVTRIVPGRAPTFWEWFIPSAHVVVGAGVLALSVGLTVAVWRFVVPSPAPGERRLATEVSPA